MKKRTVAAAVFFASLATAHSTVPLPYTGFSKAIPVPPVVTVKPVAMASGWEPAPEWSVQQESGRTLFTFTRSLPDFEKANATVLVFARNMFASDTSFRGADKPLLLPFYFLPYLDQPNYTEQWRYEPAAHGVQVALEVSGASDVYLPGRQLRFRYVVLPNKLLLQKKHSPQSVRRLSYDAVLKTFDLAG